MAIIKQFYSYSLLGLMMVSPLYASEKRRKTYEQISQQLSEMQIKEVEHPAQPFSKLPQELNWQILEFLIANTDYANIGKTLKSLAATSKKNNTFINSPNTTEKLINFLNQRTKNKVRTAGILHTRGAMQWLGAYLKTEEGQKELGQVGADEQKFRKHFYSLVQYTPGIDRASILADMENDIAMGVNINFNAVDKWGHSLFYGAVIAGANDVVEILLKVPGINVNIVDIFGYTALDVAKMIKPIDYKIIDILKAHGAKTGEEIKAEMIRAPKRSTFKEYERLTKKEPKVSPRIEPRKDIIQRTSLAESNEKKLISAALLGSVEFLS